MPATIMGGDTHPGGRKYNEDRWRVEHITTKTGSRLAVAVLSDGVGGEERGERAAQLGVDAFFDSIREADIAETPRLLSYAVKEANLKVFAEATKLAGRERMAATMVAAAIENDETLYIANAGDSRIYLCRDGRLTQLTRDHSFANVMVWTGKMTPAAAASNPDANRVMRVLGTGQDIQVDLGMYQDTDDYGKAQRIGRQGLKLQTGDSILLCSDGLIKHSVTTGQAFITLEEIAQVLHLEEGDKAAQAIMSSALGRIPAGERVDNITLALLQTEDPSRAVNREKIQRKQRGEQQRALSRRMVLIAAGVGLPLAILLMAVVAAFAVFSARVNVRSSATAAQIAQLAQTAANGTDIAVRQTAIVGGFTRTPTSTTAPTSTPVPPLEPGEIARLFRGRSEPEVIVDDKRLIGSAGDIIFIAVNHRGPEGGQSDNGNVYLEPASQLQFSAVSDPRIQIKLLTGSDLFIQTGPYPNGAEIELAGSPAVAVIRGCLAAYYAADNTLTADCFDGVCGLSTDFGASSTAIDKGKQVKLDIAQLQPIGVPRNIPQADYNKYLALLSSTGAGRQDIRRCNLPVPATLTPPPTPNVQATARCEQLRSLSTPCP